MPIRPLLNRCPLEPDESLPSLLARLQAANYYTSPRAMADVCRPHLPPGENQSLSHLAETWPVLSAVTRLPPTDLYHASFHPYAPALALPWETVSSVSLPDGVEVPLLSARMRRLFLRPYMMPNIARPAWQMAVTIAAHGGICWQPFACSMNVCCSGAVHTAYKSCPWQPLSRANARAAPVT